MKPALGRSLGTLMGRDVKPVPEVQTNPAPVPGAGVRSLMAGTRQAAPQEQTQVPAKQLVIPYWYFFGVDLLFLALAILAAWPNPAELSWKGRCFCLLLVVLGGASGVGGVLRLKASQQG